MQYSSSHPLPSMESLIAALTAQELGSFSAAALELGVTHAAISRRVDALENWAGQSLFERKARGVQVTEAGQRILVRLAHALEHIHSAGNPRSRTARLPVVRISVTPSFAQLWLIPRIARIEGNPATLRLEVQTDLKHADLLAGEVDLAIRYGRGHWKTGTEIRLFNEELCPALAPSLLTAHRAIDAATLARLPLLHMGDATGWRAWARQYHPGLKPKDSDRTFGGYAQCLEAAHAGLGVVLWNRSLQAAPRGLIMLDEWLLPSPLSHYLLSRPAPPRLAPRRSRIPHTAPCSGAGTLSGGSAMRLFKLSRRCRAARTRLLRLGEDEIVYG